MSLNVLMIGRDPDLFDGAAGAGGDARRRHQVYAAALRRRYGPESSLRIISYAPRSSGCGVEVLPDNLTLYPTRSLHRGLFVSDVVRLLPAVLRGWRPDVVTPQTPWEEGSICYLLGRALRARFVPQLHFDLFSAEWLRESRLNRWRRWWARRLISRADGVRVVSRSLGDRVESELGVARERIFVAPVGVEFEPSGVDRERPRPPTALFVGRFYPPKNLDLWIDVASRVAQGVPLSRFVLAGDGPLRSRVEAAIARAGLGARCELLSAVDRERLPEVYARADVLLLTSSHESFGRVIVEAFLSGVPVVSTDCTGPRELIRDGVDGFLHARDDAEGLAVSVARLLEEPGLARVMGERGRERIGREHSLDAQAERLVECWGAHASGERERRGA